MVDAARDAGLLAGITVIDLTKLLPGPLATRHLAEMGATVLKFLDGGEIADQAIEFEYGIAKSIRLNEQSNDS